MSIGILALQGAFAEHANVLTRLNVQHHLIRNSNDLTPSTKGLILPGGESTAIGKLLVEMGLLSTIKDLIEGGLPVFGTCAGMILLAKKIEGEDTCHFGVLDATVRRNAYGRQLSSFTTECHFEGVGNVPMVFIRAPYISNIWDNVSVLATVDENIVAVQQNNILAMSFHPELTNDTRIHEYFLKMVSKDTKNH